MSRNRSKKTASTNASPQQPMHSSPQEWLSWPWLAAMLVGIVFLAYAPVFDAGFIWDDDDYVIENMTLRDWNGLARIWFDPTATPQYYPLVHTTLWIDFQLWNLWAGGYHITNCILHAIASVILWRVLRRLEIPGAWLAAAVFAIHPVHVESVAWVTERKNVLSGLFALAALLTALRCFAPNNEIEAKRFRQLYIVATLLFGAALLSKTVTCSIPVVVLLLLWYRQSPGLTKATLCMIPWLAMGAASGLLTAYLERVHVGARGAPFTFSMFERVVIAGRAVWFYWQKLVWPQPLVFMYPRWKPSEFGLLDLTYPLGVIVLLIALYKLIPRIGRGPLVAVGCFLVSIFPALGFINIYPMRYSFVADHFQYLASIGPIVLLVAFATLLAQRYAQRDQSKQRFAKAVLSAPILIMMALTWIQSHDYHDLETLWTRTLYKNPNSFVACFYLSRIRESQERHEEATELLLRASELQTDDMARDVYEALIGHGLNRQGRTEEAKSHFAKSLEWNPENFDALTGLATLLSRNSASEAAIPFYRRAIQVNPTHVAVRTNFATALVTTGDLAAAEQEYLVAIKLEPNSLLSRLGLGSLFARQGRLKEAEEQFLLATKIDPTSQDAARLLARVRADQSK